MNIDEKREEETLAEPHPTIPCQAPAPALWPFHACLLLLITFLVYGRSLGFAFVWDDSAYVQQNYAIQGLSWTHLWAVWTRTFLGHYAPVHHTALMLLYALSHGQPFGFHLGQVLIHAGCVLLVYWLVRKLEGQRVALLAALLFTVHPTNVETVAWISETKSTLAFFLFLLSFAFFIRSRERHRALDGIWSGVLLILSLLAKINTIVAPAIFLLYDWLREGRVRASRLRSLAAYFAISAAFAVVHLAAFHGSEQNLEGAYYGGLATHLANLPLLLWFYAHTLVFPHPLSAWHMFAAHEGFDIHIAVAWLVLLVVVSALLVLVWRSSNAAVGTQLAASEATDEDASRGTQWRVELRHELFWVLWFLIFLAPVLQIIPFPIWVADRYLYIPVVGGAVLAAKFFWTIYDRATSDWLKWAEAGVPCVAIALLSWQTWSYLPIWRNNLTLWQATTPNCASSAFCHGNLGDALLQSGRTHEGMQELIRSVQLRPAPVFLIQLADAYTLTGYDYLQARIAYDAARQQGGSEINSEFYAKLARLELKRGDLESARQAAAQGAKLDAADPGLLAVSAFLQWRLGDVPAARASLDAALAETNSSSNPAAFLVPLWGNPVEVRQLLAAVQTSH